MFGRKMAGLPFLRSLCDERAPERGWMTMLAIGCSVMCLTAGIWARPALAAAASRGAKPQNKAASTASVRARTVDGVPLVPITKPEESGCIRLAKETGRLVPCPQLLMKPIPLNAVARADQCLSFQGDDMCGSARYFVDFFGKNGSGLQLEQSNFEVPNGYVGFDFLKSIIGGSLGYFVYVTTLPLGKLRNTGHLRGYAPYCIVQHLRRPIRVHGYRAELYSCGDPTYTLKMQDAHITELFLGAELLQWSENGFVCQLSFNGHSRVNVALDVAVADSVRLVRA
ncbi:MAG: hypothetical protein ACYCU7_14925 [Acidimicrobiales bacterium]